MNYMYGKDFADETEAAEIVGKIRRMIDACEPDVQWLVKRKIQTRNPQEDVLRQLTMQRSHFSMLNNTQNYPYQGGLGSALGLGGRWWP